MKFLLIGIALFLLSYSLFVLLTGVPFSQPFKQLFISVWRGLNVHSVPLSLKISQMVKEGMLIIIWLTPATFMLFAIGIYERATKIIKAKELVSIDLLGGFGLIVFVGYILIFATPFNFPKYQGMMIPFLLIPVAPLIIGVSRKLRQNTTREDFIYYFVMVLLILTYYFLVVKDPLYSIYGTALYRPWLQRCWVIALLTLPLPVVFWLLKIKNSKMSLQELLIITALFVLLPSNLSMDFYQAKANYSTNYLYGEKGMKSVVTFIRANHSNDQLIFARKDIGWASGAKWIQTDDYLAEGQPSRLKEFEGLLHSLKPSMVVISYRRSNFRSQMHLHKIINEILNPSDYDLVNKIGDFEIYKLGSLPQQR